MLFSGDEPLYAQLRRQGQLARLEQWAEATVEELPTIDHEIRALPVQAHVNGRIDEAIDAIRLRSLVG